MKKQLIENYIRSIDFNGEWDYNAICEGLRSIMGEQPAVDITWKKDVVLNEDTMKASEVSKIDKISIVFTDDNDKISKVDFKINEVL